MRAATHVCEAVGAPYTSATGLPGLAHAPQTLTFAGRDPTACCVGTSSLPLLRRSPLSFRHRSVPQVYPVMVRMIWGYNGHLSAFRAEGSALPVMNGERG